MYPTHSISTSLGLCHRRAGIGGFREGCSGARGGVRGTVLVGRSVCETNREVHKANAEMEKVTAVFERGESGWRIASRLEVPEAITQGKTIEEARENLNETIHLVLEVRR